MSDFDRTRRHLLRNLGLAGGSSLFPSLLGSRASGAAEGEIPTRFILFVSGYGIQRSMFLPKGTENAWELPEIYAPLAPHKSDLTFLDGLDMLSTVYDPNNAGNAHFAGATHAFSANLRRPSSNGWDWSDITIDQFIANQINKPTPLTRFPSLELAVALEGNKSRNVSNATGDYLPVESDPDLVFKRLFPTTTGTGPDLGPEKRKLVMQYVSGRFGELKPRLSALDRQRLDAHATALHDLESRLSIGSTVSCKSDDAAVMGVRALKAKGGAWWAGKNWYETSYESQLRVMQLALACDLTRVISLSVWDPEHSIDYTPGMLGTTDYHDLVHKTGNGPGGPLASPPSGLASDPAAIAVRKRHSTYEAKRFAQLLQLLRELPTADGKTMLDHSVVLWAGHIAWGGHELAFLPWILAGSAGGHIKSGRFISLPRLPHPKSRPDGWADGLGYVSDSKFGPGHGNLFVSIANAMGVPITTFGEPRACTGPLTQLRG